MLITKNFPDFSFNIGSPAEPTAPCKNEIPFMDIQRDEIASESDLPDGTHPVFFYVSAGRGKDNKYTHSAISICRFMQYSEQREQDVKLLISEGAVGCLYIKDHKVISLTAHPRSIERIFLGNFQEILIRIGEAMKALDHSVILRKYTSDDQYKMFAMKTFSALKKGNALI